MRVLFRLSGMIIFATLLCVTCLMALAAQEGDPAASAPEAVTQTSEPVGGFITDGVAVNVTGQSALSPSLAISPGSSEPWVAFVQNNRVLVAKFNATDTTWAQQDGVLNLGSGNVAGSPSLALAGTNRDIAWTAWRENIAGTEQIVAAWFNGTNWNSTGVLNHSPQQNANHPALAAGSTVSGSEPLPWAAWEEIGAGGLRQIVASRASVDASATGGYSWQAVDGALNFDPQRDAHEPDLAFAGTTPWVVWSEDGGGRASRIFAKYAVTDASASGGFQWEIVGRQEACASEVACALNGNANQDARGAQIAAGQLAGETTPTPWIVFAEQSASGAGEIRVMRLDTGGTPADASDDRFIPVGGVVNNQCLGPDGIAGLGGAQPDIAFVGNVPHVAWVETLNGYGQLFVCHLADARPGQERWDLDTLTGINRAFGDAAVAPSLASNGSTPYVAWQEDADSSNVYVDHRYPDGPAWGRNYPPFIRTISWSRERLGAEVHVISAIGSAIEEMTIGDEPITGDITFTTSCDHVNGWEHIQEVQFKLANAQHTAFVGRYVASLNQVLVEDPNNPGLFLGPFTPGTGAAIATQNVILNVPAMRVVSHGGGSAVLDIDWVLSFRMPTMFQDYKQQINILYDNGQQTGFFQTGVASLDYRMYLPTINK